MAYTPEQIQAAAAKLAKSGLASLTEQEKEMLGITGVGTEDAKTKAAQLGVQTAISYGISEALLAAYPELKPIYEFFKSGNTGKALEELYKTSYYQDLSPLVKKRVKEKTEQPGVYLDSLDKYKTAARKRLVSSGIKINMTNFDALASNAYERGLDDNQFDELNRFSGKIT
jgi:hypothetical protein